MAERTDDSALTHLRSLLVADLERERSAVMEAAAQEAQRARLATQRAAQAEADRRSEAAERSADTSAPRRRFEEEIEAERIGNELRQRLERAMQLRIEAQVAALARQEALAERLAAVRRGRVGAVGAALWLTGTVAVVAIAGAAVAVLAVPPAHLSGHRAQARSVRTMAVTTAPLDGVRLGPLAAPSTVPEAAPPAPRNATHSRVIAPGHPQDDDFLAGPDPLAMGLEGGTRHTRSH